MKKAPALEHLPPGEGPVPPDDVATTNAINYNLYHQVANELHDLQQWILDQIELAKKKQAVSLQ